MLVTAQVPDSVNSTEASVSVSLPTDDATLVADAFAAVRTAAPESSSTSTSPVAPEPGVMIPETWMFGGLAAVGLGLLLLLYLLSRSRPRP